MASTSTSSGIQPHYLDTNNGDLTQLTRPGSDNQMQPSLANGISQPTGGIQSAVLDHAGWLIGFLRLTWIITLFQSIFGVRKEGNSERPRPETFPTNNVKYGNNNRNVGNTNNSHNNTTTFNGPVGAYGNQAQNRWTSPQFYMGPQPHPPS